MDLPPAEESNWDSERFLYNRHCNHDWIWLTHLDTESWSPVTNTVLPLHPQKRFNCWDEVLSLTNNFRKQKHSSSETHLSLENCLFRFDVSCFFLGAACFVFVADTIEYRVWSCLNTKSCMKMLNAECLIGHKTGCRSVCNTFFSFYISVPARRDVTGFPYSKTSKFQFLHCRGVTVIKNHGLIRSLN